MRITQATTFDSVKWMQRETICINNVVFIRFIVYQHIDGQSMPHSYPFRSLKEAYEMYEGLV